MYYYIYSENRPVQLGDRVLESGSRMATVSKILEPQSSEAIYYDLDDGGAFIDFDCGDYWFVDDFDEDFVFIKRATLWFHINRVWRELKEWVKWTFRLGHPFWWQCWRSCFKEFMLSICDLFKAIFCRLSYIARKQTSIEKYLLDKDCAYLFDYEYDFDEKNGRIPNWVKPVSTQYFTRVIRALLGGDKIIYVGLHDLDETQLSDAIQQISHLRDLQHLYIRDCIMDRHSIELLGKNDSLKVIDLRYTSLSEFDRNLISQKFPDTILLFQWWT